MPRSKLGTYDIYTSKPWCDARVLKELYQVYISGNWELGNKVEIFENKFAEYLKANPEDFELLKTNPGAVRANAYDLVINGVEVGGGSIRIHNKDLQAQMFDLLGFTKEEAQKQFGFLMNAFEFGAPPQGGLAFGFDRLCSLFGGSDSIRDFIAFPKNNSGRDVMIDSPSEISDEQLKELNILSTIEVK
jgi:aspartyl-tRNA synthetase